METSHTDIKQLLDELIPDPQADFVEQREKLLKFIIEQRHALRPKILDPDVDGFELGQAHTAIFDAFVHKVYEIARAKIGIDPDLCIFAVGSYGRGELCHFSDIDIAYTSGTEIQEGHHDAVLDFIRMFYDFMDSLEQIRGLRFSFVYRPFCDAAQWNYQDLAALIDGRFLAGDRNLLDNLRKMLRDERNEIPLILNLLNVRDELYAKEETLYLNQPHIKLGKGGLRNIQLALWMLAVDRFVPLSHLYEELADPALTAALGFMLKARSVLHILTQKPTDRLTYNPDAGDLVQAQVASALGFTGSEWQQVYAFMEVYYRHAKYLHLTAELIVADMLDTGIPISGRLAVKQGRIYCAAGTPARLDVEDFFLILGFFQQYGFEIDAEIARHLATRSGRMVTANSHNRLFHLLTLEGEISRTLMRMHRVGLLEHFVPGFERAMMTRSDRVNDPYTVGRHTLEAVYHLDEIKQTAPSLLATPFGESMATEQEVLHRIYTEVAEPELIYLALLFHDIDKPAPNHEWKGAEKARIFAERAGLNPRQIEEVCFLVQQHLTMIEFARYHEVTEAILTAFANTVESPDRLRMLYLLTYCDAKANGPENWTDVDRDNLQRLYAIVLKHLSGPQEDVHMTMAEVGAFLHDMPIAYRINRTSEEIYTHVRMVRQVEESQDPNYVSLHFVDKPGFTELHFCGSDRIGLLRGLTGILYAHQLNLREAAIYTTQSSHIAVDICKLIHPLSNPQGQAERLDGQTKREVSETIRQWFEGELKLEQLFEERGISMQTPLLVNEIDVGASSDSERFEVTVRGADQMGFVHRITGILTELGLSIQTSKCSILGGVLTNRFYVTQVNDPRTIRQELLSRVIIVNPRREAERVPESTEVFRRP